MMERLCEAAYASMALFCSGSETAPCFFDETRMYPKQAFIVGLLDYGALVGFTRASEVFFAGDADRDAKQGFEETAQVFVRLLPLRGRGVGHIAADNQVAGAMVRL
jgi:hypothetical protein